jgi:hypothetical protein
MSKMFSTYSLYSTWLIFLSVCQFANSQACYFPNGVNSGYKQCSSNGGACCYYFDDAHHDPCFSNGLCQSIFFGYIYRGACTDSKWGPSCPNVCTNGTTPSPSQALLYLPPPYTHQHPTDITQPVNDDQEILRFCSPLNAYCCQNSSSTADCCAAGVGFEWNNATWINYQFAPQQDQFSFNLPNAYYTISSSISASTAGTSATAASVSGTASALSSVKPTNTAMSSNSSTTAIGAGLGVGLGVPLLVALAGLLWLMARRRYEKPQTTVPVASRSSKPELHGYSSGPAPGYNGGYSEGPAAGLTGRSELPIETGYGRAELGQGERR